jgi:lysophospholipase L1-like esterase
MKKTILITSTLFISLILLSLIPSTFYESFGLKSVDLYSDIRKSKGKDSLIARQIFVDSCQEGVTCFEDYSKNKTEKTKFLKAIFNLKNNSINKVRIAYFGDSYIDGDILTAYLRDSLQAKWGGRGVGFIPITSHLNYFRQTIGHTFKGFDNYNMLKQSKFDNNLAAGGFCFIPTEGNYVQFSGVNISPRHKDFHEVNIFYQSNESHNVSVISDNKTEQITLVPSKHIQSYSLKDVNSRKLNLYFPASENLLLYGVSFEDNTGIFLDNFASKGNSGLGLAKITQTNHRFFDSLQSYNLVVLQFGLNVVSANTTKVDWYLKAMKIVIETYKTNYPNATILLVSVPDRSMKKNGAYETMPSIPMLVNGQRKLAQETEIVFYDLFTAMGGENSMVDLVNATPAMANGDYTHLKFNGGKKIANILMGTINYEYEKYVRKNEIDSANVNL